jgi:hypothetical protein
MLRSWRGGEGMQRQAGGVGAGRVREGPGRAGALACRPAPLLPGRAAGGMRARRARCADRGGEASCPHPCKPQPHLRAWPHEKARRRERQDGAEGVEHREGSELERPQEHERLAGAAGRGGGGGQRGRSGAAGDGAWPMARPHAARTPRRRRRHGRTALAAAGHTRNDSSRPTPKQMPNPSARCFHDSDGVPASRLSSADVTSCCGSVGCAGGAKPSLPLSDASIAAGAGLGGGARRLLAPEAAARPEPTGCRPVTLAADPRRAHARARRAARARSGRPAPAVAPPLARGPAHAGGPILETRRTRPRRAVRSLQARAGADRPASRTGPPRECKAGVWRAINRALCCRANAAGEGARARKARRNLGLTIDRRRGMGRRGRAGGRRGRAAGRQRGGPPRPAAARRAAAAAGAARLRGLPAPRCARCRRRPRARPASAPAAAPGAGRRTGGRDPRRPQSAPPAHAREPAPPRTRRRRECPGGGGRARPRPPSGRRRGAPRGPPAAPFPAS